MSMTETDRELLELAAKAAGLTVRWHEIWQCFVHVKTHNITNPPTMAGQRHVWVPLDDDGDALRLAVKLRLRLNREINCGDDIVEAFGPERDDMTCHCSTEDVDGDPYAATRRAIVRAAAEIGRAMKGKQ